MVDGKPEIGQVTVQILFFPWGAMRQFICVKDKIVVPKLLQKHVIDWYHTVLCHPGMNQTEETISQYLW